MTKNKVSDKI